MGKSRGVRGTHQVALDSFFEVGKLCTFGLRNIKHVDGAESYQNGSVDGCGVFAGLGLGVLLLAGANHGRMRMPFYPFITLRPSWFHA